MLLRDTLREVMQKLEYDAPTLAGKLGVSANTVWRYLKGTVAPSQEVLARLAALGKLDYAHLLVQKSIEQQSGRATMRAMAEPLPHQQSARAPQHRRGITVPSSAARKAEVKKFQEVLESLVGEMKSMRIEISKLKGGSSHERMVSKKA